MIFLFRPRFLAGNYTYKISPVKLIAADHFLLTDLCRRSQKKPGLVSKMSEKLPRVVFRLKEQPSETLVENRLVVCNISSH